MRLLLYVVDNMIIAPNIELQCNTNKKLPGLG